MKQIFKPELSRQSHFEEYTQTPEGSYSFASNLGLHQSSRLGFEFLLAARHNQYAI